MVNNDNGAILYISMISNLLHINYSFGCFASLLSGNF